MSRAVLLIEAEAHSRDVAGLVDELGPAGIRVMETEPVDATVVVATADVDAAAAAVARVVQDRRPVFVILRGETRGDAAWRLVEAGAADVLRWDDLPSIAARVAARVDRWCAVEELARSREVRALLVGDGTAWKGIVRTLVEIGAFTDVPLLITGESGTGKELAARLVHRLDAERRRNELVVLDCTTIVPTLSGSEFFGHERGAFTGAASVREGAFARADGGTLFLDEVAELEPRLQAELLRVFQEGTYKRVGSDAWRRTSFRLICATNRDLADEVAAGRFRHDLYYRIAGAGVQLPPLRERRQDILPLARHFLAEVHPGEPPEIDAPLETFLVARDYPGNVRELRHLVLRMALRHVGAGPLTVGDLPDDERAVASRSRDGDDGLAAAVRRRLDDGATLKEISSAAADAAVELALADEAGNVARAARRRGITPRAIQLRRAQRRLPAPLPAELDLQEPTG